MDKPSSREIVFMPPLYFPSHLRVKDVAIHRRCDTTKRAAAANELAGKFGIKLTDVFWTMGQYDGVIIAEGPNDEAMAGFAVAAASMGNIKTQALRAFRAKEVDAILDKVK